MKKILVLSVAAIAAMCVLVSCGTSKTAAPGKVSKVETVEGIIANQAPWSQFGYETGDGINKSGDMVKIAYVYFSGNGTSQILRIAEEMARSAAYSMISDAFSIKSINEKTAEAMQGSTINLEDGESEKVAVAMEEFNRYLRQQSANVIRGFTPFGKTAIQFNDETKEYTVWARVGMPAKNWRKLYDSILNYKPKDLSDKELNAFSKIRNDVLGAVFQFGDDED